MAKDELLDNLDAMVSAMKSGVKIEKPSDQFYDDMEWWLLVAIMRDPVILSEIHGIIGDPRAFVGFSDFTAHSLIFQALTNLNDDGKEIHFEAVYAECEKIRESNPLIKSYSRKAIVELDFQATTRVKGDPDNNRIRGKFCAEQVLRRK